MKIQELLKKLIIKCLQPRRERTIKEIRYSLYRYYLLPFLDYAKREVRFYPSHLKKYFTEMKNIEREIGFIMSCNLPSVLSHMYKKGSLLRRKRKIISPDYNCKEHLWSYYLP